MTPDDILSQLAKVGFVILRNRSLPADPWQAMAALVGVRPLMVERQVVRPIEGGASFASSRGFTPFHTDSQDFNGVSPLLQVMECRRAASKGGETILLDAFALLTQLDASNPPLSHALRSTPRTQRFYFGNVDGPTVAEKGGHVVFTHSPIEPSDALGRELRGAMASAPIIEFKLETGDILLLDNHRMLHGRRLFKGEREFIRLLAWFRDPLYARTKTPLIPAPATPADDAERRIRVVLELLTGASPGYLAKREGISEATLYKWRNLAMQGAQNALVD